MTRAGNLKRAGGWAILAVALAVLAATPGKAQEAFAGKFTLPVAAHWRDAVLPAGDYTLEIRSATAPYLVMVRGEGQNVVLMARSVGDEKDSTISQLTLVQVNGEYAVRSFDSGELGLTFSYPVSKSLGAAPGSEARVMRLLMTANGK